MKRLCLFLLLALATSALAQSPLKETLAYSRETIPGTPGGPRAGAPNHNPFPTSYLIYVVVSKGAKIAVRGVCLKGDWYPATAQRVDSPVVVAHDPAVPTGEKDTLVKQTSDDVYQVELGEAKGAGCPRHIQARLAKGNEVVVCLESGGSRWYGLARKIVPLHPAAAM